MTLWPLQVSHGEYFGNPAATLGRLAASEPRAKAGLRLRLRCGAGLNFNALALDSLPLYLNGADEQPFRLYEQLLGNACALFIKSVDGDWVERLPTDALRPCGFDDAEAALPVVPQVEAMPQVMPVLRALRAAGVSYEVVPGVTARIGSPLSTTDTCCSGWR